MARGAALTSQQVRAAIAFNRRRSRWLPLFRRAMGLTPTGALDEAFVRRVADWQEDHIAAGEGDGKIGPKTEGHLNIQHPKATAAANKARSIQRRGYVLFDSWGNDVRDNNGRGGVDDSSEQNIADGAHFRSVYSSFGVVAGTYTGLGWGRNKTVTVPRSRTITGSFKYRVCADITSQAYHEAGVMPALRSTAMILSRMRAKGYVWRKSNGFPSVYLPGDFICTWAPGGGHSGIVVRGSATTSVPTVVELPGPSTLVDLGGYDPASTNDIRLGSWTKQNIANAARYTYLGRLLHSKTPP